MNMWLRYRMSRRRFLHMNALLLMAIAKLPNREVLASTHNDSHGMTGYGVGSYNQGEYPGYKICLPLMNKENK